MNLTLKISIYAICAMVLSFSILIIVDVSYQHIIQNDPNDFVKILDVEPPEKILQTKFLSEHIGSNKNKNFSDRF